MGAAVAGAVYAGLAYFNKDKDVVDSLDRFGSNVRSDARGDLASRILSGAWDGRSKHMQRYWEASKVQSMHIQFQIKLSSNPKAVVQAWRTT